MRAPLLACLPLALLPLGCASSAPEEETGPRAPYTWETRPDRAEVLALRDRVSAFLRPEDAACLAAVVRPQLDTTHALLAAGLLPDGREALLAALPPEEAAAWQGEPAPWTAAEARLTACAEALAGGASPPALPSDGWPTASQRARAAYLRLGIAWRAGELGDAAVQEALQLAAADWAAMQRLEEMRALGGFMLPPPREHAWHVEVAERALERGRALVAIQHAAAARALTQSGQGDPIPDRALLARAYLAARQAEPALKEAEAAASLARTPALRARSQALRGEALLLSGEARDAADAFAQAERAALDARDEAGVLRQALNRAVAWLKAGEPALAKEASAELQSLAVVPVGPEAPDLLARRTIIAALAGLLAGEQDPIQAAEQVDGALRRAREAGAVSVLDTYSGLPERLRKGKP